MSTPGGKDGEDGCLYVMASALLQKSKSKGKAGGRVEGTVG